MRGLSEALNSGQAGPLLSQLGLDSEGTIGVGAFLKALSRQAGKKNDVDGDQMQTDS